MKIMPIKTGTICCNKTVLTYGKGFDKFVEIPSIAWLVEKDNKKILVDSGMCDTQRADKYHYKNSRQLNNERIDVALKAKGISTAEIEIVILTHLHWDHCANLDLFENALFFVQKKELEYAKNPIPPYYSSYESPHIGLTPGFDRINFEIIDGNQEILSGVRILQTPGHSPGHQSVIVEGKDTLYVIAGDACMCNENLLIDREKDIEFTMIGRYIDANDAWKSLETIKSVADVVLPGHEADVLTKEVYE